jgi:hypothetical protein
LRFAIFNKIYFQNLESLRLRKVGHPQAWYTTDFDAFARLLTTLLPNLRALELQVYWDDPDEHVQYSSEPPDVEAPFGTLKGIQKLSTVALDVGLLIDTSADDALTQLLDLSSAVLPDEMICLILTNVKLSFLDKLIQAFKQEAHQDVLSQLMTALLCCTLLVCETFEELAFEAQETLKEMATQLATMDVELCVNVRDEEQDTYDRVV